MVTINVDVTLSLLEAIMDLKDILTIKEKGSWVSIDFKASLDGVLIDIENEWYGNSEGGFGANLSIDLNYDEVLKVRDFLDKLLNDRVTSVLK